jgi:N-carbamoylputrescine amidase
MRVTVCQFPNEMAALETTWHALIRHVQQQGSDFILLPEMPFYPWLSHTADVESTAWDRAVDAHDRWLGRLDDLAPAVVAGTRPIVRDGKRLNEAYLWDERDGYRGIHTKYYLPDEAEFWEAAWCHRGDGQFQPFDTPVGKIGFLICTEIWFFAHARAYAKEGVQLLLCPRATPTGTGDKWLAGGRTASVVSGAFCLSSNLAGITAQGGDYAGLGWIIGPESGDVLGVTSEGLPFLTLEIDLAAADLAKSTYPRYVLD